MIDQLKAMLGDLAVRRREYRINRAGLLDHMEQHSISQRKQASAAGHELDLRDGGGPSVEELHRRTRSNSAGL